MILNCIAVLAVIFLEIGMAIVVGVGGEFVFAPA
jgi:hypothetical protein